MCCGFTYPCGSGRVPVWENSTPASGDTIVGIPQLPKPLDLARWSGNPLDVQLFRRLESKKLVYLTSVNERLEFLVVLTFSAVCATLAESNLRMSYGVSPSRTAHRPKRPEAVLSHPFVFHARPDDLIFSATRVRT